MRPPDRTDSLVQGGQGRSAAEVRDCSTVALWCLAVCALAVVVCMLMGK